LGHVAQAHLSQFCWQVSQQGSNGYRLPTRYRDPEAQSELLDEQDREGCDPMVMEWEADNMIHLAQKYQYSPEEIAARLCRWPMDVRTTLENLGFEYRPTHKIKWILHQDG
jgi:hypothetical protein